ncbi:MAG: glycosyltransferase family 2 protein, partial [Cyclobacteriaceae bacterium]
MKVSLVIAVYNEEKNIEPLLHSINQAMSEWDYEVVLVDDGSRDATVKEIKKHGNDRVKLVVFNRNYGQTSAMAAGIDHATGDYIVTLDGDLQNDPSDIPAMIELLEKGDFDVVAGKRAKRKDSFFI